MYTTRPIRDGEQNQKTYHFVTEAEFYRLNKEGRVIEARAYQTVHGIWRYFTVNDGQIDLERQSYLAIGVLQSYLSTRQYFGEARVIPIYIEVDDGIRLQRALDREKMQENQKYTELCRRFLADAADFSEEKILEAGIERRFINDNLESCIAEVEQYILKDQEFSE